MPPLSKKRNAYIASTAKARKALRQDSEEELELDHNYKRGLGGDFDVADSDVADSNVADSDVADSADSDVEEEQKMLWHA